MITEAAEHKYINFNSSDWAWALTHLPLIIMIILLAYLPSAAKLLLEYSGYVAVFIFSNYFSPKSDQIYGAKLDLGKQA